MSPSRRIFLRAAAACALTLNFAVAEPHAVLMQTLSGEAFESWSGLEIGSKEARLAIPGEAVWRHPDGVRGGYHHGFRSYNDGAADWHQLYGLQFEARVDSAENVGITVSLVGTVAGETPVMARTVLAGGGWQTLTLPWSAFDAPGARRDYLLAVKELRIKAAGAGGVVKLRNVRAVKAPALSLDAEVRGKAVPSGGTVEYLACVGNVTKAPQAVMLSFARHGWEVMSVSVEPSTFVLGSGETRAVKVRVQVPSNVPPGGHEVQVLQAVPNGDATRAGQVTFVTAGALPHPNILHDKAGWNEVREKVKSYPWAREAQDALVTIAEKWVVPEIAQPPGNDPNDNYGPFVFPVSTEREVYTTAVAWQLTRNKAYAEKVALFLRRLSDPVAGYPKTLRAMNNSLVQEGGYFQHAAMAYDMVLDAGVLSEADRAQIDHTFRLFMETVDRASLNSQISNWNVATMTGALYCALSMQDLAAAERFYSGPGGLCDQLAKGVMDDGWWYECAISYNAWVASEFSQAAIALRPWGINFKDAMLPANYSSSVMLIPQLSGGGKIACGPGQPPNRPFGMTPHIWGRQSHPARDIRQMWNSLLPFLDYRGVMFGVNDSTERRQTESRGELGGASPFELAYYLFRDPAYAALIKLGNGPRDLLYGVPELPADTPRFFEKSACADNVGLVMLRSQTARRPIREQIQATLHYGTHGWAHGHYDRTNLLSLMRYGKSFYNPEMIWYGYPSFMYKFYVQNSVAHNMVVVDEKNQEATPGDRLLFHSGRLMQAAAVETKARWSNPPYGGMVYDYTTAKNFEEKTWQEGRYVPMPKDPPAYGSLSGYTELVLQRRLMVVTDDYIVLADYVKGDQPHRFENLFQIKGFRGLEAAVKEPLRHDAQWNPDPVGSAQFVTDCDWYSVKAPAKACFEMQFEPGGRDQVNESGVLKMDVHTVWPAEAEIMVGTAPENIPVQKRLYYSVRGDGRTLAEGKMGAWILGRGEIDVPLEGIARLELETRVDDAKKPTVFWGCARIVTSDGKEIPLSELSPRYQNVEMPPKQDADYQGGPVKIAGIEQKYSTPGEPKNPGEKALISIDLAGKNAVRLKASVGGDYPLGSESQMRKTYAIKPQGDAREACFLTVIEPYENRPAIKKAEAVNDGHLRVELNDGRVQEINIRNFKGSGKDIEVSLRETRAGQTQTETTATLDN